MRPFSELVKIHVGVEHLIFERNVKYLASSLKGRQTNMKAARNSPQHHWVEVKREVTCKQYKGCSD
jgi:hypothetical protein